MGYPGILKRFRYPIQFITLNPKKSIEWNGLRISVAETVHSVLNYTIRVDLPGPKNNKKSFSISGDGQITEASKKLVSDVNLHFQEVYSLKPEIPVHADFETVLEWAMRSKIESQDLSHFSRAIKAKIHQQLSAKKPRPGVIAAKPWARYLIK
jgi:ribonuclease BN (tRNA processing enzyme)